MNVQRAYKAVYPEIMFSGHEIQIYQWSHSPPTLDITQQRWLVKGEIFHWLVVFSSAARPRLNTSRLAVITT